MSNIPIYSIQDWLFKEAEGNFTIDLAESGIQYKYLFDLDLTENHPLNYSLDRGDYELRCLIASLYNVPKERVMITHGSQEALYLFYRTFIQAGDHVITFKPGWQQSWDVPKHLGANVTAIQLEPSNDYQFNILDVIKSITPRTRLIILNYPNNPTGTSISQEDLKQLIELCNAKRIMLINDEEYLTNYDASTVALSSKCGVVSSLSKVYGFPGLRIGWFIGPVDIVEKMVNYRRYTTVSNSYLCEKYALQILRNQKHYIDYYEFLSKEGLSILSTWIKRHPQLKMIKPQGTPFAYISFPKTINTKKFSKLLLSNKQVLVMPAEVFDDSHAIRLSFGRPKSILQSGLKKIDAILENIL